LRWKQVNKWQRPKYGFNLFARWQQRLYGRGGEWGARVGVDLHRSRSSKVDNFGTTWKRMICDFPLVRHNNVGPILHRVWDTATYFRLMAENKITNFSYPFLIRRSCTLCSLWNFAAKLTTRKLEWSQHNRSLSHFDMIPACNGRTDRQTDKRTDIL